LGPPCDSAFGRMLISWELFSIIRGNVVEVLKQLQTKVDGVIFSTSNETRLTGEAWKSSRVGILDSVQENCAIISGMCALTDNKLAVVLDREPDQAKDLDASGPHIRCPKCGWTPRKHDLWSCDCGHLWNTFDTGGICPACLHAWAMTQCLSCKGWSPHSDWYAD
jgi:hypothetical protein